MKTTELVGLVFCFFFFTQARKKKKEHSKRKNEFILMFFYFFSKINSAAYEGTVSILNSVPNKHMPRFKNMHFPFFVFIKLKHENK